MADSPVLTLRESVDAAIAAAGSTIIDRVKGHYVDAEIDRRGKLLIAGVDAIRQAELDLRKVDKPDVVHLAADGNVAAQHYTKSKLDEIKKTRERYDRLNTALSAALTDNLADSYKKLDEAIKKGGGKTSANDSEE